MIITCKQSKTCTKTTQNTPNYWKESLSLGVDTEMNGIDASVEIENGGGWCDRLPLTRIENQRKRRKRDPGMCGDYEWWD